jgi:hypothetical protein
LNVAGIKIMTLIIMTALTGLGILLVYPTITISAQENMTNTDQNMTITDQNMTSLDFGTISGAGRGAG